MQKDSKIFIAGHKGMLGSAVKRNLVAQGYKNLLLRTRSELDLTDQSAVSEFFKKEKPEYVFVAAARVGGIEANRKYTGEFIYQNLMISINIIHNAYLNGVKKLLFMGAACIYPKYFPVPPTLLPQPIKEEYLLAGQLEETNEAYAMAKLSGLKMCQMYRKQYGCDFISAIPVNAYGLNDNYSPESSHVVPALLKRFHEAKINNVPEVACWGTGSPIREFIYTDDLADALIFLMQNYSEYEHINIGTGVSITIKELSEKIAKVVGYTGKLVWDKTKPDGMPIKLCQSDKLLKLGWQHKMDFEEGLRKTYQDFLTNKDLRK